MTEELAAKVSKLNSKLVVTNNLIQNESRAIIPESYLNSIKYLIKEDTDARLDFYKLIRALATKYNKIYKEQLNNI